VGSYKALKRHPAAGHGDHLDRVHSDQIVLEMIRLGRLVRLKKGKGSPPEKKHHGLKKERMLTLNSGRFFQNGGVTIMAM
jgi:hypothetical protein